MPGGTGVRGGGLMLITGLSNSCLIRYVAENLVSRSPWHDGQGSVWDIMRVVRGLGRVWSDPVPGTWKIYVQVLTLCTSGYITQDGTSPFP